MVDYYRILKVSPKATANEIKSAYRRLARELHPDRNDSAQAAKDFALMAKAYQTLSNSDERARYDFHMEKRRNGESVIYSENPHAQRLRRMQVQRRMDAVVDRFIADERRETWALQQTVFPVVALFISTLFVGMLKPQFFSYSNMFGKSVFLVLFLVALWHIVGRIKFGFSRYTYAVPRLHDSIFGEEEDSEKFSRWSAIIFLTSGIAISLGIGWAIGKYLEFLIANMMPHFVSPTLHPEMIFYPPIAVLIIDTMHSVLQKADI